MFGLLLLAAAISTNALTTGVSLGVAGQKERRWTVAAIFFAVEFVLAFSAIYLGRHMTLSLFGFGAARAAPLLVGAVGLVMLYGSLKPEVNEERWARRAAKPSGATLLALALAFDDAIVALGFGLKVYDPSSLALVVATSAAIAIMLGMTLGDRVSERFQTEVGAASGVLVMALGAGMALDWI